MALTVKIFWCLSEIRNNKLLHEMYAFRLLPIRATDLILNPVVIIPLYIVMPNHNNVIYNLMFLVCNLTS